MGTVILQVIPGLHLRGRDIRYDAVGVPDIPHTAQQEGSDDRTCSRRACRIQIYRIDDLSYPHNAQPNKSILPYRRTRRFVSRQLTYKRNSRGQGDRS